jgi:hypothetical protein
MWAAASNGIRACADVTDLAAALAWSMSEHDDVGGGQVGDVGARPDAVAGRRCRRFGLVDVEAEDVELLAELQRDRVAHIAQAAQPDSRFGVHGSP